MLCSRIRRRAERKISVGLRVNREFVTVQYFAKDRQAYERSTHASFLASNV